MRGMTVNLSRRYEAHGATFDAMVLREPTGADYWALGPIEAWQPNGSGGAVLLIYHEVIRAYAERLAGDNGAARLAVLDLGDTFRIEAAVRDFFRKAEASTRPATSSSTEPAKASLTSAS